MPTDFLIGKKSALKVESTRNYTKENKTQLSVDPSILKNKSLNKYDISKDPMAAAMTTSVSKLPKA